MKKSFKMFLMGLGLVAALTACGKQEKDAVAKVDDRYISKEYFDKEYTIYRKMYHGKVTEEDLEKVGKNGQSTKKTLISNVIDSLVIQDLVNNELKKNKVEVTQDDIKEAKDKLVQSSGGEEVLKQNIEKMGLSIEDVDYIIAKEKGQAKLFDWYKENHAPSDEEINKYFDEHKNELVGKITSHILVKTEDEANAVIKEIEEGKSFEELAKEKSTDKASGAKGGELGVVNSSTPFVKEFLTALEELKEGEVSKPVKSQFGYHIIKVTGIKDKVEDFKDEIVSKLSSKGYTKFLQELQKNAKISYFVPNEVPTIEVKPKENKGKETNKGIEEKTEEKKEEKPAN